MFKRHKFFYYYYTTLPIIHTRASLIRRLSFGMPNYLLRPLANGLLMRKILAASPAAIPICIDTNDKPCLAGILDEIDKAIRATARTITNGQS